MQIIKFKKVFIISFFIFSGFALGQKNFSDNPLDAVFETKDTKVFWSDFDKMDVSKDNPFKDYFDNGSAGVKGFTKFRIISADSLFAMVKKRKTDYEGTKNVLNGISAKEKRVRAIYSALKYWYPQAKFPPVYFVYGRYNSGGASSDDGIIIGTEMLKNLDGISGLIAHELIHYQQKVEGKDMLLKNVLLEGGADFIGEFISGDAINAAYYQYGNSHSDKLYKEFVTRMKEKDYNDWLYGTSKKDDRPNDLGYWLGYKICEAYFDKQADKRKAIYEIINIKDPLQFLKESGLLDSYILHYQKSTGQTFDAYFKN